MSVATSFHEERAVGERDRRSSCSVTAPGSGVGGADAARSRSTRRGRPPMSASNSPFLEFTSPRSSRDPLARRPRARRIVVVPMFIAQGGHLKADLPKLVTAARVRHPGCEIVQTLAVGEADPVIAAMADYARRCATGDVG